MGESKCKYLFQLIMKVNVRNDIVSPGYRLNMAVANGTHYSFVNKSTGECILQRVVANEDETTFALLANLYICEGKPGKVIRVRAKKRTSKLDFISCMQKALERHYKDKLVGRSHKLSLRVTDIALNNMEIRLIEYL